MKFVVIGASAAGINAVRKIVSKDGIAVGALLQGNLMGSGSLSDAIRLKRGYIRE